MSPRRAKYTIGDYVDYRMERVPYIVKEVVRRNEGFTYKIENVTAPHRTHEVIENDLKDANVSGLLDCLYRELEKSNKLVSSTYKRALEYEELYKKAKNEIAELKKRKRAYRK